MTLREACLRARPCKQWQVWDKLCLVVMSEVLPGCCHPLNSQRTMHVPTCGEHLGGVHVAKRCAVCLHYWRRGSGHTPAGAVLELHHVDQTHIPRAQLLQAPELRQRQASVLGLRRLQRLPRLLLRMRAAPL